MRLVLSFLLAALALSQTPLPPNYPPVYSVQFFETQITSAGSGTTYGQVFYDSVNGLYRQDRFSGMTDIMCALGLPMTGDSDCSHYVVSGNRYLYYPYLNQCCYCCNNTNGCGVLTQNWLSGALYLGQQTIYDTSVYAWNQSGNIYYETAYANPAQRTMVGLTRDNPGLLDYFEYLGYVPGVPSTAFSLPQGCTTNQLCGGLCPIFRNQTMLEFS